MFRIPGYFGLKGRSPFTSNIGLQWARYTKPATSIGLFGRAGARQSSTWANYNRHYRLNRINWKSLQKPAIFTASFCVVTTLATPYLMQIPPFAYFRSHPRTLVYAIIGVNVAGFLAWRSPAAARYMSRYGLLVKDNIRSQWSLLGSAFSHQEPFHLLFNMLMLYSFGTSFAASIGAANFLSMYLSSAVISSFVSVALPTILRLSMSVASLGASGALFSVFGAFAYLLPKAPVALFFFPIPGGAWVLFLGTVVFNVAGVAMKWARYDFAAHLGGCLAGVGFGWYYTKLRESRIRQRRASWR